MKGTRCVPKHAHTCGGLGVGQDLKTLRLFFSHLLSVDLFLIQMVNISERRHVIDTYLGTSSKKVLIITRVEDFKGSVTKENFRKQRFEIGKKRATGCS